jgi:hypothetical protein
MISSLEAHVIIVTTMAYRRGHIDFGNLDGSNGYWPAPTYSQSRLLTYSSPASRAPPVGTRSRQCSVACHPEWAARNMTLGSAEETHASRTGCPAC